MKISNLKTCVYDTAGFDKKQATPRPGAYQAQRDTPCNKFIKWPTSGEVAKINTQNQEVL
jgi:hypothetical protein